MFEIELYCPITRSLETDEEISEVDSIKLKNEGIFLDGYEKEVGYLDLVIDNIKQLNPKCFVPVGATNKRYATEVVFESGCIVFAVGKPSDVKRKLDNYLQSLAH